ncbi:MAG: ribose 5-phosphate isomerase B [Clostridia bacterium]|nr:ribose 5-phosphate isomerase B [Clostridia bacterium]
MKIAIGSDHVGYELKEKLKEHLEKNGHQVTDMGTYDKERTDYPVFAKKVAVAVSEKSFDRGILVCSTGVGISISANKVRGIRAALCSEPYSALRSRQHNNSNVLALGSDVVGEGLAMMIVDNWLSGVYEGERHEKRINMIADIENENT